MANSGYTWIAICKYLLCLCFCLHCSQAVAHSLHNQLNAIDGPRLGEGLCDEKAFRCHSEKCIPYRWVCDGEPDCDNDNRDELPQVCNATCPLNQFKCETGPCIPNKWVCDKDPQCKDGSDENEELCESHNSCEGFQCDIGICVPEEWECDGKVDCPNGLDEMNCHKTCSNVEFTCGNGACIDKKFVCDEDIDCLDGKDEENCGPILCESNDFKCPSEDKCISRVWVCDGYDDCNDGADEKGCLYTDHTRHPEQCNDPSHWLCADKSNCVHKAHLCDGQEDCKDGSDEKADVCNNLTCRADQYQCKNRQCIAGKKQCDGEIDCVDNSDEENCANRKTCEEGEFDCGDGNCIALANVCDGKPDCPGHEDEPKGTCQVDECLEKNGGCNQGCVNDLIGHHCTCRTGFALINNSTCEDVDECQVYGVCSHTCINSLGSFTCECYEGYFKEPSNPTFCKAAHGGAGSLIFSKRSDIRKLTLDRRELTSVVENTKVAGAMDFVYKIGTVFWMETYNRTNLTHSILYKAPIDAGFHKTIVIDQGISGSDGIAIDWVYDHVYWTDTVKNTIEVADFDGGMRKTLIKIGMDEPRSLAVNPHDGWLFWSDWGVARRIERSGMDGSHRSTIISHGVQWPNGITLDLVKKRIYWVDAGFHVIASANYDGSGRKTILHSIDHLYQPYSLSVFEDTVYWADWGKQAVFKANKFNGTGIEAMVNTVGHDPMIVHVYHPYKQQKGINYCIVEENFCSHMCFPAPKIDDRSPKISCSCPDGMRLEKDSTVCVQDVPSTPIPVTRVSQNTINVHETIVDIEVEPEEPRGYITVIFTIIASIVTAIFAVLLWILYRHYIHKNTVSMNFENLIYKKTTTTEVQPVRKKYGGYSPPPATLETTDEARLPLNTISQSTESV